MWAIYAQLANEGVAVFQYGKDSVFITAPLQNKQLRTVFQLGRGLSKI